MFCKVKCQRTQDKLPLVSSMFLKQFYLIFEGMLRFALAMAPLNSNLECLSHSANRV